MSIATATETRPDVWFGEWEPDPDAPPIYVDAEGWRRGFIVLRPQTGGWRRKRFARWWDDRGREMGRWVWERRAA